MSREQNSETERSCLDDRAIKFARTLWRVIGIGMRHLLVALRESRRKQAIETISCYADLIAPETHGQASNSDKPLGSIGEMRMAVPGVNDIVKDVQNVMTIGPRMNCPVTRSLCQGDLAHLCHDWGCARKGGLSPVSHENF